MARPTRDRELDWQAIYEDWLTGTMSNSAIARKHGCSPAIVGRRVKADQWSTTNGPTVKPKLTQPAEPATAGRRADKPDLTNKAQTAEQLRKRAKDLAQRLMAEVEDVTTYEGEIGDIITMEESDPVRRRAALKAISVDVRIKNLRELTAIIDAVDPAMKKAKTEKPAADAKPDGKKAQRQAQAEAVVQGRFAPRVGPKLVANG